MSKKSTTKTKKAEPVKKKANPVGGEHTILSAAELGLSLEPSHGRYPWTKLAVGQALEVRGIGASKSAVRVCENAGLPGRRFADRSKGGKNYCVRIA